jgi:hypothetical protein
MSKAKEILAKKKAEAAAKKKKNAKVGELVSKKNKVRLNNNSSIKS